jgi:citrate synthase
MINDRLPGQTLFTKGDKASLAIMDKQIFRLIGKATTMAASVLPTVTLFQTAQSVTGWPIASVRAETSSQLLQDSATLARERNTSRPRSVSKKYFSFLYQMDHAGQQDYVPNPVLEKALDVLFLLHADHELNASW